MRISINQLGISALLLAAICWVSAPSFAQHHDEPAEHEEAGEHHEGGHDADVATPEAAHDIVAEIFERDLMIQHYIETGELTKIHKPAFEAKDLVKSLVEMGHSDHKSDSAGKLSAASKRIGASAKLLDKYGDAEDAPKTASAYKTFGAAIQVIKELYPDVTPENYWTCSMHPDVWKASSGSCPKCKMNLIEKGESHDDDHEEDGNSEGHEEEGHH